MNDRKTPTNLPLLYAPVISGRDGTELLRIRARQYTLYFLPLFCLKGLPYKTFAQKGGMQQFCGQTVQILRTERGRGQKFPEFCERHIWKPPKDDDLFLFRTTMCSDMLEEEEDDSDSCSDDETNSDSANSFDDVDDNEASSEENEDNNVMRELPINDKLVIGRQRRT